MSQWILIAGAALVGLSAWLASIGFQGRKHVLGIDLGTTFSVVAVKRNGTVEVIPNHETGKLLTPSVVSYVKNAMTDPERKYMKFDKEFAHFLVGEKALERRAASPSDTIYHAKRFIGKSVFETTAEIAEHPFRIGNRDVNSTELLRSLAKDLGAPGATRSEDQFSQTVEALAECVEEARTSRTTTTIAATGETMQSTTRATADDVAATAHDSQDGAFAFLDEDDSTIKNAGALAACLKAKRKTPMPAAVEEDSTYQAVREVVFNHTQAEFRVLDTKWRTPVDIGTAIVKKLRDAAETYLGHGVADCVICVPAKFGKLEIQKTHEVFSKAGFRVARIMDEPTAAAVAYGLHKSATGKTVIVYDLGGGTLDASLLHISTKAVNVLGTSGDDHLGGSDFDHAMLHLLQQKCAATEHRETANPETAENLKKQFSSEQSASICGTSVTRTEFEETAKELFARALAPVEQVLSDQMMKPKDIHHVVLVGGASRMPRIRAMLADLFGQEKLNMDLDPDLTVAIGAANIDQ
ncbi:unnamed protein product [Amoebophrya sp. A120]|nr:unnamed protein product [Amoebophrya sp. A120]|eukprot:GSA120T00015079001.1